jgi:error-prone DNA polymerase
MGFYSPQSLVQDARRHGVEVRRPDLLRSGAVADLEPLEGLGGRVASASERIETRRRDDCLRDHPDRTPWVHGTPDPTPEHRRDGGFAVRLGLDSVRGIGKETAERIVAARAERPFTDLADLSRRAGLTGEQLEALATAGAAGDLSGGASRREALWAAGWTESADQLPGTAPVVAAPALPEQDEVELTLADLWATGMTPDGHPFAHLRTQLAGSGVVSIRDLAGVENGRRVTVAGLVTHRQRPGTAGGVTFLNLEDETGMLNVICTEGLWRRHRKVAVSSSAMLVRGILERSDGVTNLAADRLAPLGEVAPSADAALAARHRSRDFR